MEKHNLTCIQCPMGCALEVTIDDNGGVTVTGNTCPRGEVYGTKEVTAPTRTVTSFVKVLDGEINVASVKTKADIPKNKIFEVMEEIKKAEVTAPVKIGDVIVSNAASTGVDVVATKNVAKA